MFTGFPWNLWAYSTSTINEFLQILNIIGLHSYNLLVITLFSLPAIIFLKVNKFKKYTILSIGIFSVFALFIFGNYEININKKNLEVIENKIYVKIISPNFDLKYGLSQKQIEERFKKIIKYSDPIKDKETLFVWPEGVFSGYSYDEILIFKNMMVNNFSDKHLIILGTNKLDKNTGKYFNSMLVVNKHFEIIQRYDKTRLVPFGEFLPFENFLNKFGLKKITEGHGSF